MDAARHATLGAAIGAGAAVAPDLVLLTYGWRRRWLPSSHPLVRAHRFLHSPLGLALAVVPLAYGSHLLADRLTH